MGKFTEFKLALASLPKGNHQFDFHLDKQFFVNMENADIHDADLDVVVDINHAYDAYDMHIKVSGTVTLLCDRCLDTLVMPLESSYHVVVKFGDDYNDESDELLIIPANDPVLNIAYMIHDTVALAIPMKHVHPQGKCNRAMSDMLRKHRATSGSLGEEAGLDDEPLDGLDDPADDEDAGSGSIDPRWNELKKLTDNN